MNGTTHIEPDAGEKDSVSKFPQPRAEWAETNVAGAEAWYQQDPGLVATHIGKSPLEKSANAERREFAEQPRFA